MSNYQVEPANRPQALTKEAIKALRHEQVQGISRRELLRGSLAAGMGLWLLEVTAGTIGFLWPNLIGKFGGDVRIGTFDDVKTANATLPISDGFPVYVQAAKAFVVLVDPSQQRFIPGADPTGRRHGPQRPGPVPALPAPRLQAQPVPEELLDGVPLPRVALRPPGRQGPRRAVRAGATEHGPLRHHAWTRTAPSSSTPGRSPSARCPSRSASRASSRRAPPPGASDPARRHPCPPRSPMTDQPGRPPEERLPAPRPSSAAVPAERFSAPQSAHRNDLSPERAAKIVRQSANARWVGFLAVTIVGLFVIGYYFYELGLPGGLSAVAADGPDRRPAGHLDPARLQHLPGQLRAVPRRQRRGWQGPDAQPPGQAVRPPEPGLHPQHASGRRPLRLRQPAQHHADLVEHREPARPAQLQADRGRHQLPPRPEGHDVPGAGSRPVRARHRPGDRARRRRSRAGWIRTTSPHRARRRTRRAGPTSSRSRARSPSPGGSPGASGSPAASEAPTGTVLKESALNIDYEVAALSAPADAAVPDRVREQGRRGCSTTSRSRTRTGRPCSRATSSPARRRPPTTCPRSRPAPTRSTARVHPNMTGTLTVGG